METKLKCLRQHVCWSKTYSKPTEKGIPMPAFETCLKGPSGKAEGRGFESRSPT